MKRVHPLVIFFSSLGCVVSRLGLIGGNWTQRWASKGWMSILWRHCLSCLPACDPPSNTKTSKTLSFQLFNNLSIRVLSSCPAIPATACCFLDPMPTMRHKSDDIVLSNEMSRMFNALVVIVVCPTLLLILIWLLITFDVCWSLMSSTSIGKLHLRN